MYGRSVSARVSVGRAPKAALMRPHTPLAPAGSSHVHVGADNEGGCATCGVDMRSSFNDTQKAAWASNCGPGEKRRPLGTTRAAVSAGLTGTFSFASLVPFKAFWLDIDDQVASDFSVTSIQFGLNQLIVGGAVNASAFNSRSGKDFTDMFDGCLIYPSIPAVVTVRNNSLEDLYFEATMWGNALIQC